MYLHLAPSQDFHHSRLYNLLLFRTVGDDIGGGSNDDGFSSTINIHFAAQ